MDTSIREAELAAVPRLTSSAASRVASHTLKLQLHRHPQGLLLRALPPRAPSAAAKRAPSQPSPTSKPPPLPAIRRPSRPQTHLHDASHWGRRRPPQQCSCAASPPAPVRAHGGRQRRAQPTPGGAARAQRPPCRWLLRRRAGQWQGRPVRGKRRTKQQTRRKVEAHSGKRWRVRQGERGNEGGRRDGWSRGGWRWRRNGVSGERRVVGRRRSGVGGLGGCRRPRLLGWLLPRVIRSSPGSREINEHAAT